jgi:two-component system, response regulator YesN
MFSSMEESMNEILVVDDDPLCRGFVRVFIRCILKLVAVEAATARHALQLMRKYPFEIVITDLEMPQTNGLELLREVKRKFPATHVIVMSGDFERNGTTRGEIVAMGAAAAIPKAELETSIAGIVQDLLGRS